MISNDTTAQNIHSTWIQNDDDTIYVGLMNNTLHFQEMFRRKVISYSAVSHGKIRYNVPFTQSASPDTLHVTMQTELPVYPMGAEVVSVELTNNNPRDLFLESHIMFCVKREIVGCFSMMVVRGTTLGMD